MLSKSKLIELALESGADYYGERNTGELLFSTLDFNIELFASRIQDEVKEHLAVIAWNHYMDTCKKYGLSAADNNNKWCAASVIREVN